MQEVNQQEQNQHHLTAHLGLCLNCKSSKLYKDGFRRLVDGQRRQRLLCRQCGFRFTEPLRSTCEDSKKLKDNLPPKIQCNQLCAIFEEAKKLDTATETKTVAGESQATQSSKGKIIEYGVCLQ